METGANYSVYLSRLPVFAKGEGKKKKEDKIMLLRCIEPKIWKDVLNALNTSTIIPHHLGSMEETPIWERKAPNL